MRGNSIIAMILACIPCLAGCSETFTTLPQGVRVPWDISKQDNLLVQDFVVGTALFDKAVHRYTISIGFYPIKEPLTDEDREWLKTFVGGPQELVYTNDPVNPVIVPTHSTEEITRAYALVRQGKYITKPVIPGVMIPIRLKIERIDGDRAETIMAEKVVNTEGATDGANDRLIDHVTLPPGKYRISIKALEASTLPPDMQTFLEIWTRLYN